MSYLDLLDYRRRVVALYAEVRRRWTAEPEAVHEGWRQARDGLFGQHPQSALDAGQRERFAGLRYYPYNPGLAFTATVIEDPAAERVDLTVRADAPAAFHRFGVADLPIGRLEVYWLDAYGGGVFIPFRDGTSGETTYGGGRYLLDTVKGADLGSTPDGRLILDFNFAYHPSCHYNPIWPCPLAPRPNWLTTRIEAGERAYEG